MKTTTNNPMLFLQVLFVFIPLAVSISYGLDAANKIDVEIGGQKTVTLPLSNAKKVEISDPSVLKARISGKNTLELTATKKGITSISVFQDESKDSEKRIDLIATTWNILPEEIEDMIKDIPGVQLRKTGQKLTLMGALLTEKDALRIENFTSVFSEDVQNLTYYDSKKAKYLALQYILKAIGNPNVNAEFSGDNLILTGTVYSTEDKELAETAASAYIGSNGIVSNTIRVLDLPVEIDVTFVQLTPTSGSEYGADADKVGVFQGPSLSFNPKGQGIGSSLQIGNIGYNGLETLTYLESKGLAKTIDKPHIATISGKKGRVHYGGEIGVKTSGTTGGDVNYKSFGLILEVTPVVGPENMISVDVKLEVSQPTALSAGADIQFQTFETSTHGNVRVGETLVLSGLKQMIRERMKKNVPFFGDIPILNLLFANDQKSDSQTNIVVLLTPHLPTLKDNMTGPPGSEGAEDLINTVSDPAMELSPAK